MFSLEHPSQYFIESRRIRTGSSVVKTEPVPQKSQGDQALEEFHLTEEELAQFEDIDQMDCS